MTPERWQRVKELFHGALERSADERPAFLAEACGDDDEARAALEHLLDAHAQAERFLETPAVGAGTETQPPPLSGQVIGHYEIRARLGVGGMGEVYEAYDRRLKRLVAIKLVAGGDARAQARLWREAEHASGLNHPNICVIYEIGEAESLAYIVMERVEGRPLSDVIPDDGFPTETALGYTLEIASALAHAHAHGIVHRDLKSANVMVTPEGRMKVLDFGLARRLGDGPLGAGPETSSWTIPGTIAGTLSYMAPEVLRGERADARSDVWALGVVLHEMLTGERPFAGQTPFELSSVILNGAPRALPARAPASLLAVVRRCLQKDPAARYPTAIELQAALEAARSGTQSIRDRMAATLPTWSGRSWRLPAVAITALLLLGAVSIQPVWKRLMRLSGSGGIRSLVVLPLANVSGDPAQDYLSDGLTEALIADLGTISTLRVTSRTTAMSYRGTKKALPQIARELGVDAVVEGSVAREGNRLRITAELIEASSDRHLWAQTYEASLRDVLVIQRGAVREIAGELRAQLTPRDQARLTLVRTVDAEVYESYLKGRYYWNKRTEESLRTAIEHFDAAVRGDPTYAPAHAALADSYNQLGTVMLGSAPPSMMRPRAAEAAIRALQIDPELAEAHATLGYIKHYDWQWAEAERELRRALELNPSYSLAHIWYANFLVCRKRLDAAVAEVRKAEELDPLSMVVLTNVGWTLDLTGRLPEAVEEYRKALELDTNYVQAHWRLGDAYARLGRYDDAAREVERAVALTRRSPSSLARLAHVYARSGRRMESKALLDELLVLSARQYVSPQGISLVYLMLGDDRRGFEWLEKAYAERSNGIAYLAIDPDLVSWHGDPRFRDLLRRVGLPE
jgi:serine/threonine protein kinase/tetratricopeptide (TPR) repeat protein